MLQAQPRRATCPPLLHGDSSGGHVYLKRQNPHPSEPRFHQKTNSSDSGYSEYHALKTDSQNANGETWASRLAAIS